MTLVDQSKLILAAREAIQCQDACNLSGLALSLADNCQRIREAYDYKIATRDVNRHPVVTMFLLKMAELNGYDSTLNPAYEPAEKACQAIINGQDHETPRAVA